MEINERVNQARAFAIAAHQGQKYGDKPYVVHLDAVVEILKKTTQADTSTLQVGYLHDVLEDTDITVEELKLAGFSCHVIQGVQYCTDEPGPSRKARKQATYERVRNAPHALGTPVKWADRLANVQACLEDDNYRLFKMYAKEDQTFRMVYHPSPAFIKRPMLTLMDIYAKQMSETATPMENSGLREPMMKSFKEVESKVMELMGPVSVDVPLYPEEPHGPKIRAYFWQGRPHYNYVDGETCIPLHLSAYQEQAAPRMTYVKQCLQHADNIRLAHQKTVYQKLLSIPD